MRLGCWHGLLLSIAAFAAALDCEVDGDLDEDCDADVAVFLPNCRRIDVDELAERHGFVNRGSIGSLHCHFLFQRPETERSKRSAKEPLRSDVEVAWLSAQRELKRVKRDGFLGEEEDVEVEETRRRRVKRGTALALPWRDPLYQYQWYLRGGGAGGWDMGVREAWLAGYSGRNVTVSILDDGIQPDHPDLAQNYEPLASYDVNDHDHDPTPRNNGQNKHGTRCAGEVSAVAGNDWCGVGVAFNSKIGGVRLLDGRVTDSVEAASLSHNPQTVDIYSASWGPDDDGRTLDGPGRLARQALHSGAVEGRRGLGSIFVWASGNGGSRFDSCSYDGYTTSLYTLSISSASIRNQAPWYLEKCPATIASTYSSGTFADAAVVSTDVPSTCTRGQTGTSASAPMAAAIVALALEANPSLAWRDIQHLVLRTANPTPLLANPGWYANAVGRQVSNTFGYGLMNASAMVQAAKLWKPVSEQHLCSYTASIDELNPLQLADAASHNLTLTVGGCQESDFPVLYLEHVQVGLKVKLSRRGALKALLRSPMGTEVLLLPGRSSDSQRRFADFTTWPILSVHTWGEDPRGNWTLTLDVNDPSTNRNQGTLYHWSLRLYGTSLPAQTTDSTHAQLRWLPRRTPAQMAAAKDAGNGTAPGRKAQLPDTRRRFPFFRYPTPSSSAPPCSALSSILALLLFSAIPTL